MGIKDLFSKFNKGQEKQKEEKQKREQLGDALNVVLVEFWTQGHVPENRATQIADYKAGIAEVSEQGMLKELKESAEYGEMRKDLIKVEQEKSLRYLRNHIDDIPFDQVEVLIKHLQDGEFGHPDLAKVRDQMERKRAEPEIAARKKSKEEVASEMLREALVGETEKGEIESVAGSLGENEDSVEDEKLPYETEDFRVDQTLVGKKIFLAQVKIPHDLSDICKQNAGDSYGLHEASDNVFKIEGIPGVIVGRFYGPDEYRNDFAGWVHIKNIEPISVEEMGKVAEVTEEEYIDNPRSKRNFQRIITENGEIEFGTDQSTEYYDRGYVFVRQNKS